MWIEYSYIESDCFWHRVLQFTVLFKNSWTHHTNATSGIKALWISNMAFTKPLCTTWAFRVNIERSTSWDVMGMWAAGTSCRIRGKWHLRREEAWVESLNCWYHFMPVAENLWHIFRFQWMMIQRDGFHLWVLIYLPWLSLILDSAKLRCEQCYSDTDHFFWSFRMIPSFSERARCWS